VRVIRAHEREDRRRRQAADGELAGTVQEFTFGDDAMRIEIIEFQQFGAEIFGSQSAVMFGHWGAPHIEGSDGISIIGLVVLNSS
jgi:hypothetical protein